MGGVGGLCLAVGQEHAFAAGHAGELARQLQQPAHQAGDEGIALRARNAHQRNAPSAWPAFGAREQVIDDGHAHGAGRAAGGLEVHQQAGAGVHFQNGAALLFHGARDVLQDHVHACNVQADDFGGELGVVGHVGVYLVGAVNGHVAVALQQDVLAGRGHGFGRDVLALQFQLHGGLGQVDPVQRVLLLGATARVLVHHVHQLAHAGAAIAGDAHGLASARCHHLAAHHQQAVFRARNEALHNHLRAFRFGQGESGFDFRLVRQLQRDAARVVAIRGLDGDGRANLLRHFPGLFGAGHHAALGHGHAASREQAFGEVFVLRNAFGNGAGLVAFCGPNAPLCCAVA